MSLLEFFQKGQFSSIVKYWDDNQLQIATDPESAYIVAAAHFRLGNFETACSICEKIEGIFAQNANFLSMYAAILRRLSLFERAEIKFKEALEIDENAADVRNNYSNLLIDQGRLAEAQQILDTLVKQNPDYLDAQNNLERVKELLIENKSLEENSNNVQKEASNIFNDPLDEAFALEEVRKAGSIVGSLSAAVEDLIPDPSKSQLEQADLEMFKLAENQIKAKQFKGALELLNKIRDRKKSHSSLYKAASDASIAQEKYQLAEIFALNAYINGDHSIANFLNLGSLSAMRKDQEMARFWLQQAKKIDENNELYKQSLSLLFPNGVAREIDHPF